MGISMTKHKDNDWEEVLSAAARLQGHIKEAVLVGGTASAIFAAHRTSYDADHVLPNLRQEFDEILQNLESVAGWQTARVKKPVLILGSLDGIETGVRQLIRTEPLETTEIFARGQKIVVPTEGEILRIKGALILKRNATRDYLDFAALSRHLGADATNSALERFDILYPQPSGESALQQLYIQLANPHPFDLQNIDLTVYKNISPDWKTWENVTEQCRQVACSLIERASVIQLSVKNEKVLQHESAEDLSFTVKATELPQEQRRQTHQQYDAKRSLGFTWEMPKEGLHVLKAEDAKDALFTFHKYRVEHVSTTLRTLERIPCSYAQTRDILDGKSASGLSTRQLRSIENYGKACERLAELVEQGIFALDKTTLCELHAITGKDEAKNFGQFRGHQVFIEQSHYIPPKSEHLEGIFVEGAAFLNSLENTQEKAICTFLFLSRSQFFSDCNKRTANLAMNGLLMQGGYHPISIKSGQFLEKMAKFYETNDATEVMAEVNAIAMRQYRVDGLDMERQAEESKISQQHLTDTVEAYNSLLKNYTEAKVVQCERVMVALSDQVKTQQAVLAGSEGRRPGFIRSLWQGQAWRNRHAKERARLHTLEQRLGRVKAIKDDVRKIAVMAENKLRHEERELTCRRDARLKKEREEIVQAQKRMYEFQQNQKARRGRTQGRSHGIER